MARIAAISGAETGVAQIARALLWALRARRLDRCAAGGVGNPGAQRHVYALPIAGAERRDRAHLERCLVRRSVDQHGADAVPRAGRVCDLRGVRRHASGMAMSRNAVANWFFDPIISVGFPMPKIAFLPVVILWLGVYDISKITIIVVDAIFPVIAATVIAIQGVERELLWSARNMGANNRELLTQIVLPAALPQIMTGLQVALPLSLIVAVVAEMLMGGYGLGGAMMTASRFANSTGVFAGIVEIAVVGYCLVKTMALIRRRLLIWHQEANEPTTA